MKWIFGESLTGAAEVLQEQLQLAKATDSGYSIKVRTTGEHTELLNEDEWMLLTILEESSPRRWFWTVTISAKLLAKGAFTRDQS